MSRPVQGKTPLLLELVPYLRADIDQFYAGRYSLEIFTYILAAPKDVYIENEIFFSSNRTIAL